MKRAFMLERSKLISYIYRGIRIVRFRSRFSSKTLAMTRFFATVFMKGYMSRPLNFICKKRCADIAYGRGLGFATKAGILRVGAIFLCLLNLYGKQKRMSRCSFAVLAIFYEYQLN